MEYYSYWISKIDIAIGKCLLPATDDLAWEVFYDLSDWYNIVIFGEDAVMELRQIFTDADNLSDFSSAIPVFERMKKKLKQQH